MTRVMETQLLVLHQTLAVKTWVKGDSSRWHRSRSSFGRARTGQVEDLHHVEYERHTGYNQHEDDEDGLLGGSRHEALDGEGTGVSFADDLWDHDEPVQIILTHDERDLQDDSEEYGDHVVPQKVPLNLNVAFIIRVLGIFDHFISRMGLLVFSQFVLFVDDVEDVTEVDEGRSRDEDDLENPESDVGDRKGLVVADVLATRLFGVTNHAGLFITPHLLSSGSEDHDPEDEQDTEPDLPHHRGVGLDLIQQRRQEPPVTHGL